MFFWPRADSNFIKIAMSDTHRKNEKIGVEGKRPICETLLITFPGGTFLLLPC